jgi:hypothetical protein
VRGEALASRMHIEHTDEALCPPPSLTVVLDSHLEGYHTRFHALLLGKDTPLPTQLLPGGSKTDSNQEGQLWTVANTGRQVVPMLPDSVNDRGHC